MIIELKKAVKISRRTHPAGTRLNVVSQLGETLVKQGDAWCVDGTFDVQKINYVQKPAKIEKPAVKTATKKKTTPKN